MLIIGSGPKGLIRTPQPHSIRYAGETIPIEETALEAWAFDKHLVYATRSKVHVIGQKSDNTLHIADLKTVVVDEHKGVLYVFADSTLWSMQGNQFKFTNHDYPQAILLSRGQCFFRVLDHVVCAIDCEYILDHNDEFGLCEVNVCIAFDSEFHVCGDSIISDNQHDLYNESLEYVALPALPCARSMSSHGPYLFFATSNGSVYRQHMVTGDRRFMFRAAAGEVFHANPHGLVVDNHRLVPTTLPERIATILSLRYLLPAQLSIKISKYL